MSCVAACSSRRIFVKCFAVLIAVHVAAYIIYVNYPNIANTGAIYSGKIYKHFFVNVAHNSTFSVTNQSRPTESDARIKHVIPYLRQVNASRRIKRRFEFSSRCGGVCDDKVGLVVIVTTSVTNVERREAIRNTWASTAVLNSNSVPVRFCFIVGTVSDEKPMKALRTESQSHGDIIQANFVDTYRNLTMKSLALLEWVDRFCPAVKFVLKSDDDTLVNVSLLLREINKVRASSFFFCRVHSGAPVVRNKNDKWFVSLAEYRGIHYPTYCSGSAYSLTGDIVRDLLEKSLESPLFWLEDVYISGILPRKINVNHVSTSLMHFWREDPEPCSLRHQIVSHRITAQELIKVWKQIHDPQLSCPIQKTQPA
ncbi:beta-1,3-galactosyltransferase 5-like [Tubulanus polymorphus]|uniref:beta-1,3-galactosyltransferase 5-like n=1 Tax=Tubulanus polymorphus TaxID=672921 RepID=UPI003DA4F3E2